MIPAVLVQKSTKSIIKHGLYPRADMLPVDGIDPDYEWLVEYIPFPEPSYDPRIYIMVTNIPDLNNLDSFQEHPDYPGIKEYRITYSPEKRDLQDIITSIKNAEREANGAIWGNEAPEKIIFMLTSVLKIVNGFQLNENEQNQINELSNINMKLTKNLDNKNLLISQVNSNQVPNIDLGWERSI